MAEDTDPSELCMCVRRDASTQTENSIITTERELQALKQIDLLQQPIYKVMTQRFLFIPPFNLTKL